MSQRYSAWTLLREGLRGATGWTPAWRKARPKPAYDFVVVGGGGHGLATAYYLAKNHRRTRVCVVEKGWLGGGNTGRNTTVVRSNYFWPESVALYDLALRLYEGLSRELNFNVMLSQRGILNVSHTPAQLEIAARVANAMQLNGVDAELWGPDEIRKRLPLMTQSLELALPAERRRLAAPRRHRAPRRRRLGLCARRRCARRRHRRELRSDRLYHAERRLRRRRDGRGRNPGRGGRRGGRRAFLAADGEGRRQTADPFLRPAGDGQRAGQALPRHRASAFGDRRLRQPVGQGRDRLRRRPRPHPLLRPARQSAGAGDSSSPASSTCFPPSAN